MRYLIWAPRALSVGLVGLVAAFAVGEGLPSSLSTSEGAQFAALGVTAAGLLIGLRRPAVGGGLALAASACFYGLEYAYAGRFPGGWVFPLFPATALLYLLAAVPPREPREES